MIRFSLALLLLGMCTASGAQTIAPMGVACKLEGVDSTRAEMVIDDLRVMFQSDRFAALDDQLACLIASKDRLRSGKPGASVAYQLFKREMPAPGTVPATAAQVDKWLRARPDSPFARFAQLRLLYANAWNSRGSGYAGTVTDDGWQRYRQGLLGAEQAMRKTTAPLRGTPVWHHFLLALSQDEATDAARVDALFEEAVKQWPRYYDLYEVRLTRLGPKWGGSWEDVAAFIERWSAKQKANEGVSLYARLYASVHASGVDPLETGLDWPRMKASLDDLVARYPDSRHKILAASYACRYRDIDYFKSSMARIGVRDVNDAAWLRGTSARECAQLIR